MPNQSNTFNRLSVAYFPSRQYGLGSNRDIGLYVYGFTDDVHHSTMPIGGSSSSRPNFSIQLDPANGEIEGKVAALFHSPQHQYRYDDLTQIVSDFIEEAGWELSFKAAIYYELVHAEASEFEDMAITANQSTSQEKLLTLSHIPGKVVRFGTSYIQLIPRADWKTLGKRFVVIPASKIWMLNLPKSLGQIKKHKRVLNVLERHSASLPEFVLASLNPNVASTPFIQSEFYRGQAWETAKETAQWGWYTNMWDGFSLEYFQIYRRLRFALAMAILREHILSQINDLFARLGWFSQLKMAGLPSQDDIRNDISRMYRGELSFDEAINCTSLL